MLYLTRPICRNILPKVYMTQLSLYCLSLYPHTGTEPSDSDPMPRHSDLYHKVATYKVQLTQSSKQQLGHTKCTRHISLTSQSGFRCKMSGNSGKRRSVVYCIQRGSQLFTVFGEEVSYLLYSVKRSVIYCIQ